MFKDYLRQKQPGFMLTCNEKKMTNGMHNTGIEVLESPFLRSLEQEWERLMRL